MRFVLVLVLFSISVSVGAQTGSTKFPCYDPKKLKNLCMFVGSRTEDPSPLSERYPYLYQRRIFEAACVNINIDTDEDIARKVSALWNEFGKTWVCNNLAFDVKDGSLLKYGLVTKFDRFVYDICKWKIDLNQWDASDNRTLLDYCVFQIERSKGTSIEKKLQDYVQQLRKAGAKLRSEL